MNHIYRLIWDELRGAFVAVAEFSNRRGKRAGTVVRAGAAIITIGSVSLSAYALDPGALPSGAQIAAGTAQLSQQGNKLTVQQNSQRLILNWNGFDVGSQASVRFDQPNSSAVALNRVLGGAPSQVLGDLSANGQVWLVNPNGVYFGKGAQVNVGGLVVSSLSISDGDFLAGRGRFSAAGNAGAVRNDGTINAQGGVVAMLAPVVGNAGTITAGQVGLAAGDQVALDFGNDGLLSLAVERGALQAEIAQSGLIRGNNVVLSASGASALRSSVINMDGVIEATSLNGSGGRIVLDGGDTGQVHVSGRLDASSQAGIGGRIDVLGDRLVLDGGAKLDASGATGGGDIHVGGGWQGGDPSLRNATQVDVDASVAVKAGATVNGNGGEVVFWSDDSTRFAGNIDIRGGELGGNGGRAEVSGKKYLNYSGRTDARAAKGATGDLLLDPDKITIQAGGCGGSIAGSIVCVADLESQTANVLLQADNGITFSDLALNGGDGRLSMANNVSLRLENKNGAISFANANNTIEVFGTGSIYMQSGQTGSGTLVNVANLIVHGTGTNPATLPTHNVTVVGNGTPGAGSITLYGADGISVGGALSTNGGYVRIWGDSDNAGGGDLTLNSPINTNGGNLYLSTGSGAVTLNSDMLLGTGRIYFKADGSYTTGDKVLNGLLSASGDVNIDTNFTMGGRASIHTDGDIKFGNVNVNLNTGDGVLVLRANRINWGSATLQNLSTASMRLEPYDRTINMVLGDANGFASATTLNKLPGIRNLTIGREDGTGTISVSGNYNFNASGSFELVNRTVDLSNGSLTNTTGDLILTGDNITIGDTVTAKGGAGKVTIRQSTAANELHLGTGLSNATIGKVNAATLEVGRSDGGNLVFDSDITTTATTVHLKSGQQVIGIDGGVSAANLAITAGGGATISDDNFDFTTLALNVGGDSQITSSSANWGLGTVDGLTGLSIQPGRTANVTLAAQGTLGLNSTINFSNTASTLQAEAHDGFAAESAAVSGQSQATVAFGLDGTGRTFAVGGTGTALSGAALARFNGVNTLRVAAADNTVTVGAFDVTVGNRMQIDARQLQQLGAMKVGTGSLHLDVAQGGLQLDHAVTAGQTVSLNDAEGAGIRGNAVISATSLALRSSGTVALASSTHQVGSIAADVGSLAFNNGRTLTVGTVDGLDGIDASGSVDVRAVGAGSDLILDKAVHAGNSGNQQPAVLLAAGRNFYNNAGATAVSADQGRWLVYSTSPLNDTRGGLAAEFKQYAAGLTDTVLDGGSGFLYTVAPKVGVVLTGSADKTYDGNNVAGVGGIGLSVSGALDGDVVNVIAGNTARYDDKNAGSGKTVTMDGLSIDDAENGTVRVYGYALDSTSASGDIGNVGKKTISLGNGSVNDKTYDGSLGASLGDVSLEGVVVGDSVSFANGSAAFTDKNAGSNKQVTISGATLNGADRGNYEVDSTAYATINKRTVTVGVTVDDKVYDGSTDAQLTTQSVGNMIEGDDLSLNAQARFTDKNVGNNKNVVVTASLDGDDAGNYVLDTATADPRASTASITRKTIDAGTLTVAGKVYDGNRDATVNSSGLNGVVSGDDLLLNLTGQYDDKNVGTGKQVDVSLSLGGDDAGNYQLVSTSGTSTGTITRKTIDAGTLTVAGKVYDGSRDATVNSSGLNGVVSGDDLALNLSGQYDDKNVGTGKLVDVSLGLSGDDVGNYQLVNTSAQANGDITRKTIDAGTLSVAGKVYDGSRNATVNSSGLNGVVTGDDLTLNLSGQYDNKNVGTGKQVDVSLGLSGGDAGNYELVNTTAQAQGDVTRKTIDAGTLTVAGKVYDGSRNATVNSSGLNGVVTGDDLTLNLSGQYDNKNVGTGKQVDVSLGLSGGDAGNYELVNTTAQAQGDVTRKTIDAGTLTVAGKVYDGSRNATVNSSGLNGVVTGDDLALNLSGQYNDKNVGNGKQVAVSLGLSGDDAGNYQLVNTSAKATGNITPKMIDAGTLTVVGKVYDGSRDATVNSSGLKGVVAGDDLALDLKGQYDNKNVGNGKRVDVSLGLNGGDAGNYQLVNTSARSTGDVAAKQLVVGVVAVVDKRFDGTRNAELLLPSLQGVVAGDDLALQGRGQFDDAGTAANKAVDIALSLGGADAGNYVLVDARQQATAGISDLPGRNAVDAVTQPSLGSNGTRPGTNDTGAGTSPGAIAAASGALGDLTGSAQPQLGGSSLDPAGGTRGSTSGSTSTGAGNDNGFGNGAGAGNGVGNGAANGAGSGAGNGALTNGGDAGNGGNAGGNGNNANANGSANGNGNGASGTSGTEGNADSGADAGNRRRAGAGSADLATEQVLRNGQGVSISLGGDALAEPQVSMLPVFTEDGQPLGQLRVNDLGDSLSLHQVAGGTTAAPSLQQQVRVRADTRVELGEDSTAVLRMELLEDGTLHIVASTNAADLGREALAAYGLSALKQQAGVSPQQVRALVLSFAD